MAHLLVSVLLVANRICSFRTVIVLHWCHGFTRSGRCVSTVISLVVQCRLISLDRPDPVASWSFLVSPSTRSLINATLAWTGDGTEVTMWNRPNDPLSDWFFEPIMTIKDQLRACDLQESEERYLEKQCLMIGDTERMESWQNGGVEPEDAVRRGELLALARR